MMKVLVTIGAIILLVLITLPWSRDYFKQSRTDVNNALRDQVRNDQVISDATNDIYKAKAFLTNQYTKVVEGKEKLATQEATMDTKTRELKRKQDIFLRASEWVETHKPTETLVLNSRTYSYLEVRTDTSNRANDVKNLNTEIESLRQTCQMLKQAITDGESNIKVAMRKINEREGKLKAQEIQLQAWEAIRATQAICKDIAFVGDTTFDTRHLDEVDRRLAKMKAAMEMSAWTMTSGGNVPWDESQQDQGELDNIRSTKWLITGSVPAAEPTSPAEALGQMPQSALKESADKTAIATPAATPAR